MQERRHRPDWYRDRCDHDFSERTCAWPHRRDHGVL